MAINNPAFHFRHLTASFGLTRVNGNQLVWNSLVSSAAFYAAILLDQEMSVRLERLNGIVESRETGNKVRKISISHYKSYRMGRIVQQLWKTVRGKIMEHLSGEAINRRVFLKFLVCAERVHYYLYKFTPESFSLKI